GLRPTAVVFSSADLIRFLGGHDLSLQLNQLRPCHFATTLSIISRFRRRKPSRLISPSSKNFCKARICRCAISQLSFFSFGFLAGGFHSSATMCFVFLMALLINSLSSKTFNQIATTVPPRMLFL